MSEALAHEAGPSLGDAALRPPRRARWLRRAANVCFALAVLGAAYSAVILVWGDPLTALYQRHEQGQLARTLDRTGARFALQEGVPAAGLPVDPVKLARAAVAWKAQLQSGEPLGRLVIPALGVSQVVVQGTGTGDLERGPGHYAITSVPGLGRVSAVAGHRTTFGAPFRHLDKLEVGDTITFALPYGTFLYRVIGHKIVRSDDWSIIKQHGFDELVLSACHPLYSASHRWVVFARLAAVNPKESHP